MTDQSRKKLIERERREAFRTIGIFSKIRDKLERQLEGVLARIDEARRTMPNAPVSLLIEAGRIRGLLDELTDEIVITSRRLGMNAANAQAAAIRIAARQAMDNAELAASVSFFDSEATRELIGITGAGEPLAKHFAKLATPIREGMFEALFEGIATGQTNAQIARAVNQTVQNGAAAAMTIVRTETNRAYREATRKFYDETPAVIGWRWIAALDLNTCPVCWALHGKIFKTSTKFGTHPNCRCTMVPVFAGDEKEPTGPSLFAQLTDPQQRAILGPRKFELYRQGANLPDFVATTKSVFGTGRRVKNLAEIKFKIKPRPPGNPPFGGRPIDPKPKGPTIPPIAKPIPKPEPPAVPKPGDPVPNFKTPAEATAYFERRYPAIAFDFDQMDVPLLGPTSKELARLLDEYPEATERLKYIGTYTDKSKIPPRSSGRFGPGDFAHCGWYGDYIAFNPAYYRDAAKYARTLETEFKQGWLVSGKVSGTVTHEFGHAVDAWIDSLDRGETLFDFQDYETPLSIAKIRHKLIRKYKPKPGEQSQYSIHPQKQAERQYKEQIAEAFNMHYDVDPAKHSRFTKRWMKFIEIVRQRRRPKETGASKRWIQSMPDAEARAARREVNELFEELGLPGPYRKKDL